MDRFKRQAEGLGFILHHCAICFAADADEIDRNHLGFRQIYLRGIAVAQGPATRVFDARPGIPDANRALFSSIQRVG